MFMPPTIRCNISTNVSFTISKYFKVLSWTCISVYISTSFQELSAHVFLRKRKGGRVWKRRGEGGERIPDVNMYFCEYEELNE